MPFDAVQALLELRGPMAGRAILDHFEIADGRAVTILNLWAKRGQLQREGKMYAAVGVEAMRA